MSNNVLMTSGERITHSFFGFEQIYNIIMMADSCAFQCGVDDRRSQVD